MKKDNSLAIHRMIVDNVSDAIITFSKEFSITTWNKAAERMYGWKEGEVIGKDPFRLFNSNGTEEQRVKLFQQLHDKKNVEIEVMHRTKNNVELIVEAHIMGFVDEEGEISGYVTVNRDITKRKQAEDVSKRLVEERLQIEKRFHNVMDLMDEGCAIFDYDWNHIYVNPANARHAHSTPEKLIGKNLLKIIPGIDKSAFFETYKRVMEERIPLRVESNFIFEDGTSGWYEVRAIPVPEGIFILTIDITERKLTEEKIRKALKDKEVLLRELYHRTKNNMQIVYSLLGLKGETTKEESVKSILGEMRNRIMTISLVHQKLYQSKDLSNIDLKEYITELITLLMNSYSSLNKNVDIMFDLEEISVLIDTAVPVGLIINELISNSLKHAFPDGRKGKIFVHLHRTDTNFIELKVSDDGIGIPEGVDILSPNTLGAQLFHSIVEDQLGGTLELDTTNGVSCTIQFGELLYEERV